MSQGLYQVSLTIQGIKLCAYYDVIDGTRVRCSEGM